MTSPRVAYPLFDRRLRRATRPLLAALALGALAGCGGAQSRPVAAPPADEAREPSAPAAPPLVEFGATCDVPGAEETYEHYEARCHR